jgi:predicted AAA+ superfamily ATPase
VGKTTAVKQVLRHYGKPFTYRLAEGLGVDPLAWLESEWQDARIQAKSLGEYLLVIDEIQKVVGWSELVKRLWDEDTFEDVPLKVLILGSSRLLLQRGLNESLEGRYEMIEAWHWSYADMHEAFGFSIDDYVLFGGYPGAVPYIKDEERWRAYLRDSIIEPSISRDILQLERIAKPALLHQLFALACMYSSRILSYQKMLGQLQDAGNAMTLAHYLRLLGEAGLVAGIEKYYDEPVRAKASSPKLAVCNTALMTAMLPYGFDELRARHDLWGRVFESAVGAHLMSSCRRKNIQLRYWNVGNKEVDFVLQKGDRIAALEVKSADADSVSGMKEFKARHPLAKPYLIGGQGMAAERFFTCEVAELV